MTIGRCSSRVSASPTVREGSFLPRELAAIQLALPYGRASDTLWYQGIEHNDLRSFLWLVRGSIVGSRVRNHSARASNE